MTFKGLLKIFTTQHWIVEAENESEAKRKLEALLGVFIKETETSEWEVTE